MKTSLKEARLTRRAREMAELIEEQEACGLSVRRFAESRGLRPGTLHWWRREIRLKEEAAKSISVGVVSVGSAR